MTSPSHILTAYCLEKKVIFSRAEELELMNRIKEIQNEAYNQAIEDVRHIILTLEKK